GVLVAIRTAGMRHLLKGHRSGCVARLVAARAGDLPVLPGERKARPVVIEVGPRSLFPSGGGMALLAGGAERPLVRVLVAVRAPGVADALEDGELSVGVRRELDVALRRVAARAGDALVPAGQRERRLRVIERPLLPGGHGVAVEAAGRPELPAVLVAVAGEAAGGEPEEGPGRVRPSGPERLGVPDELGPVALAAPLGRMSAGQGESGLLVIERGHPSLAPVHELELPAMVLVVARLARLMAGPRMEPLARRDPLFQGCVAVEALRRADAPPGCMALQAVGAPFEGSVRRAQGAGGELRRQRRCGEEEHREEGPHDLHP